MSLSQDNCEPCNSSTRAVSEDERREMLAELDNWSIEEGKLVKCIAQKDFMGPMDLANKVAALAEGMGHHPDLHVRWGELKIVIWTHSINNLSQADFVLAAKIDQAL
ncbi:MAG: 4a-hydroxytetrahydrobiopterin dehydratase [Cyanobacteria bacterium SZAS LIN-3]|nr:4a-hydroxytetrahydrobiopterin dehydratase [Cyanobacteria bacterium SZAS LIN-3]MBS2006608.1 4a-hydroxytetrahydrobiopterin dehydratase [Cyanobacteria bacterium SZAS TMP-1]